MARNSRVTSKQLGGIYRPSWNAARKVLIAAGYSDEECEAKRFEIHKQVTGTECSSKELTNRTLDEVLKIFAAISCPRNGNRQADLADGPAKRVRFKISEVRDGMGLTDAYVEQICVNMHRCAIAHANEDQLKKVLMALNYHEDRNSQQPDTP